MRTIGVILFPGFQILNLAALTAFELANVTLGREVYRIRFISEDGGPIATSVGTSLDSEPADEQQFDTLVVVGSLNVGRSSPGLAELVRRVGGAARRVAATCTGAFVLADAGLLDGRRATTHWAHAHALRRLHPAIEVDADRIFVADGHVWTSAGMTAVIDLALALVEDDLGLEVSKSVAKKLVVYHRRVGGQSQFSTLMELQPRSDRIHEALAYARANLRNELSVIELAAAARLSPRQFSRVFREETGQSPAKAVENLRIEEARAMMEEGRHSMDVVARETGFGTRERMRRSFLRAFGQPPQAIRRNGRREVSAAA